MTDTKALRAVASKIRSGGLGGHADIVEAAADYIEQLEARLGAIGEVVERVQTRVASYPEDVAPMFKWIALFNDIREIYRQARPEARPKE